MKMIHMQDQEKHKVYFTHGDVSSSNILVRDGKVVSLVDWEMAGWFPEYWAYTTSMNVNRFDKFWKEEIPQFLQAYPRELQMDELRSNYFRPRGGNGYYL